MPFHIHMVEKVGAIKALRVGYSDEIGRLFRSRAAKTIY